MTMMYFLDIVFLLPTFAYFGSAIIHNCMIYLSTYIYVNGLMYENRYLLSTLGFAIGFVGYMINIGTNNSNGYCQNS